MIYADIKKFLSSTSNKYYIENNNNSMYINEPNILRDMFQVAIDINHPVFEWVFKNSNFCRHDRPDIGKNVNVMKNYSPIQSPLDKYSPHVDTTPEPNFVKKALARKEELEASNHLPGGDHVETPKFRRPRDNGIDIRNVIDQEARTREQTLNKRHAKEQLSHSLAKLSMKGNTTDEDEEEVSVKTPTKDPLKIKTPAKPAAMEVNDDEHRELTVHEFLVLARMLLKPNVEERVMRRIQLMHDVLKATGKLTETNVTDTKSDPGEEMPVYCSPLEEEYKLYYLGKKNAKRSELVNNKAYQRFIEGMYKIINDHMSPEVIRHGARAMQAGRPETALIMIVNYYDEMAASMNCAYVTALERYKWQPKQLLKDYIDEMEVLFRLIDRTSLDESRLTDRYKLCKLEAAMLDRDHTEYLYYVNMGIQEKKTFEQTISIVIELERRKIQLSFMKSRKPVKNETKTERSEVEKPHSVHYAKEKGKQPKTGRGYDRSKYNPKPPSQPEREEADEKYRSKSGKDNKHWKDKQANKKNDKRSEKYPKEDKTREKYFEDNHVKKVNLAADESQSERSVSSESLESDNYQYESESEVSTSNISLFVHDIKGARSKDIKTCFLVTEEEQEDDEEPSDWETVSEYTREDSLTERDQYFLDNQAEAMDEQEEGQYYLDNQCGPDDINEAMMASEEDEEMQKAIMADLETTNTLAMATLTVDPFQDRYVMRGTQLTGVINVACYQIQQLELPEYFTAPIVGYLERFVITRIAENMYDYVSEDEGYERIMDMDYSSVTINECVQVIENTEKLRLLIWDSFLPTQIRFKVDQFAYRTYQVFLSEYFDWIHDDIGLDGLMAVNEHLTTTQILAISRSISHRALIEAEAEKRRRARSEIISLMAIESTNSDEHVDDDDMLSGSSSFDVGKIRYIDECTSTVSNQVIGETVAEHMDGVSSVSSQSTEHQPIKTLSKLIDDIVDGVVGQELFNIQLNNGETTVYPADELDYSSCGDSKCSRKRSIGDDYVPSTEEPELNGPPAGRQRCSYAEPKKTNIPKKMARKSDPYGCREKSYTRRADHESDWELY